MGIKRELKILAIGTYKILEMLWLLFLIFGAVPYFQHGKTLWLKVVIGLAMFITMARIIGPAFMEKESE